jgi:hypothetical protein
MNSKGELERAYQRLLLWYPREFRDEYEQEMLGVLMSTAGEHRRRPGWREGLNIMGGGVMTRVRPSLPRAAHTGRAAVGLMYTSLVLQVGALTSYFATEGAVRSNVFRLHPSYTAAMWNGYIDTQYIPRAVAGVLAVVLVVVLVQAVGRGRDWARQVYLLFFGVVTMGLLIALAQGAAVYAPLDVTIALPLWSLELSVVILLFNRRSEPYFSRKVRTHLGDEPARRISPESAHRTTAR